MKQEVADSQPVLRCEGSNSEKTVLTDAAGSRLIHHAPCSLSMPDTSAVQLTCSQRFLKDAK